MDKKYLLDRIPGTNITYAAVPMARLDIPSFMATKIKVILSQMLVFKAVSKEELASVIFKEWYIVGKDECLIWLNLYVGGLDKAIDQAFTADQKELGNWEDKDIIIESLCCRHALRQGYAMLNKCKAYDNGKDDEVITKDLLMSILKTIKDEQKRL